MDRSIWQSEEEKVTGKTRLQEFNPYADYPASWQIGEDPANFLHRLPPSSTSEADVGPWIWVANPHAPHRGLDADLASLNEHGERLLEDLLEGGQRLASKLGRATEAGFPQQYQPMRKRCETQLQALAKQYHVKGGKWMLFPRTCDVDRLWGIVVDATTNSQLGAGAKVSTKSETPNQNSHLICVYTEDFSDEEDVVRVLHQMRKKGLVEDSPSRGIYYKPGTKLSPLQY